VNVQRVGRGTPDRLALRPGLASRKARASSCWLAETARKPWDRSPSSCRGLSEQIGVHTRCRERRSNSIFSLVASTPSAVSRCL
jgi:hypothetical protein